MTTTVTSLLCNKFGGIRRVNSCFTEELISCSDCQNVELYNTEMNSGVGIRTAKGNKSLYSFPSGEKIIGIFESIQRGNKYIFIYTETLAKGRFYLYDNETNEVTIKKDNLTVTGNACGVDFTRGSTSGTDDLFVFSNGEELFDIKVNSNMEVTDIITNDAEGNRVKGLGLQVYKNRLWLFHDNKLISSYENDCEDFSTHAEDNPLSAIVITYSKKLTAIYPYIDGLAVFTRDSSVLLSGDYPYQQTDDSPGGCASYNSLVFHGTELWFYDDTKKGVYSFRQIINGDKTLGDNVAIDIQEELLSIDKNRLNEIKVLSVVFEDRNEIWFLLPNHYDGTHSTIMIFDYIHREWVKRICQPLNCFSIVNEVIYSGSKSGKLLREYSENNTFDGEFIPSYYYFSTTNFGIDNALKIFYFPPRCTLDMRYTNDFFVKYVRNYDYTKNKKEKHITVKGLKRILYYDTGMHYDTDGYFYPPKKFNSICKFPSSTFKTLEMQVYTKESNQDFCISNIEFSKVKIKQI